MKRLAALLAVLALLLAVPAVAAAQLGPTNVPPELTQTDDSDEVAPEEDTGLTTLQLVLIFGAAIGVIALIGFVIMRDARHAAPAAQRASVKEAGGGAGAPKSKSARERERERARKRNKAKAARNQRKRNRPR